MVNKLLDIWDESEDPNKNYFYSLDSYTDMNLLDCLIKKKKNIGLLFLLNLINILNLMVPYSSVTNLTFMNGGFWYEENNTDAI